jgi:hypothetical protein
MMSCWINYELHHIRLMASYSKTSRSLILSIAFTITRTAASASRSFHGNKRPRAAKDWAREYSSSSNVGKENDRGPRHSAQIWSFIDAIFFFWVSSNPAKLLSMPLVFSCPISSSQSPVSICPARPLSSVSCRLPAGRTFHRDLRRSFPSSAHSKIGR